MQPRTWQYVVQSILAAFAVLAATPGRAEDNAAPQYAVYIGTGETRSLVLAKQADNIDQILAQAAAQRRTAKTVWVVQGNGQPFPEALHPRMLGVKIERCTVYSRSCSRSPWNDVKKVASAQEAEEHVKELREKKLRAEVLYHVSW